MKRNHVDEIWDQEETEMYSSPMPLWTYLGLGKIV